MLYSALFQLVLLLLASYSVAFQHVYPMNSFTISPFASSVRTFHTRLYEKDVTIEVHDDDNDDDDDEEEVEPGKMRVSEIKAELDMRGVSYADCFDKESLATRLEEARATGKANPEILEKFNKAKVRL